MADERIIKRRTELQVKIVRAKLNYLSIGVLTLVNIILNLFGAGIELPFYLSIPYWAYLMGRDLARYPEQFGPMIMMFTFMVVFLTVYVILFLRARKQNRIGGLLALVIADLLGNIGLIAVLAIQKQGGAAIFTQVLNVAFHIFVIVFLESGRRAAYGLTVLPDPDDDEESEDSDGDGTGDDGQNEDTDEPDPEPESSDPPENPEK